MTIIQNQESVIYQGKNWEILLREDSKLETIWANQSQISDVFEIDQSVVSRHIWNIFKDWEIDKKSNMQKMHIANSDKPVTFYNLDIILAVWYRTNSSKAIAFRKWSSNILKQYITQWVAVNNSLLEKNTEKFQQALDYIKALSSKNSSKLESKEILSLIQNYSNTWLNLDHFDKQLFPENGLTVSDISISWEELLTDILQLKIELIQKWEATELFAQEKNNGGISWIIGNVFQTFGWDDVYPSLEEKASNLLYFIVKNHVFTDGNKRSWAFSFVWFLQKSAYPHLSRISPETLTTLTLLIAESNPKEKEKIIGLILLLLK